MLISKTGRYANRTRYGCWHVCSPSDFWSVGFQPEGYRGLGLGPAELALRGYPLDSDDFIRLDLLRRRVLAQLNHVRHPARRKPPSLGPLWCAGIPAGRDICASALYLLYGLPSSSLASMQLINSPARDSGMQVSTFATGSPNGRHAVTAPACRFRANRARTHEAALSGYIAHRKAGPFREPAIYA